MSADPRPPRVSGSETRKRPHVVSTRLTPAELAQFERHAAEAGLDKADYVRAAILKDAPLRRARLAKPDRAVLARLMGELGKIGSNINQLARHQNQGGTVAASNLAQAQTDLEAMRDGILAALGVSRDEDGGAEEEA